MLSRTGAAELQQLASTPGDDAAPATAARRPWNTQLVCLTLPRTGSAGMAMSRTRKPSRWTATRSRASTGGVPSMKERKRGSVLTLSSAAARRPHPRSPIPYAAAKAGIQIMTQDVAAQAGPYGIRVNCLAPETILTERNEERIPDDQKKSLIETHPLRRLGVPNDVANAALFLVSEQADWITGLVLDVAGGAVMV